MGFFSCKKKTPKVLVLSEEVPAAPEDSQSEPAVREGGDAARFNIFKKKIANGTNKRVGAASTPLRALKYSVTRGVAENAEALAVIAGGHDGSSELFLYFNKLHIQGGGLVEAAEQAPLVGHIILVLAMLREAAHFSKGNRDNCLQLDALGQDITRVFDSQSKKVVLVDAAALEMLHDHLRRAVAVVVAAGQPGWLLRMATHEHSFEEFVGVHNSILAILQAYNVTVLPGGRPLGFGDYKDASRPLRRLLKQYGSGCLESGLHFSKNNNNAIAELVLLLAVDRPAMESELDSLSAKLEAGDKAAGSVGDEKRESESTVIFLTYDRNQSGALEFEELQECLQDLGALDHIKATEMDAFLHAQFRLADADQDGLITVDEFPAYYQSLVTCKARQQLRSSMGLDAELDLKRHFVEFATFGSRAVLNDMDGTKFYKLCKDTRLLNKSFTAVEVDIIFAKVKSKGSRRISFEQFLTALAVVADSKRASLETIVSRVLKCPGPLSSGTRAEYVKFHDDKSTYTGVYARGGPTTTEQSKELSSYLDRSEADVRGVKIGRAASVSNFSVASNGKGYERMHTSTPTRSPRTHKSMDRGWSDQPVSDEEVVAAFHAFSNFGVGALSPAKGGMDGPRFAKLCRETGLQGGKLNSIAVDIVFSKIKAKGARRVGYQEFESSFQLLAEERGCSLDDVRAMIASCPGPRSNGVTAAEAVRLHDDKSTYPDVYSAKMYPTATSPLDMKNSPQGHDRFRV